MEDQDGRLAQVLVDVLTRRAAGEEIDVGALAAAHPELTPALGEKLRVLRLLERAERGAADVVQEAEPQSVSADVLRRALPGYEILREVHRGGQGVVYQAVQQATKRAVAIKVLSGGPFASPDGRARFAREIETLARVRHPNIVSIHDSGTVLGSSYLVMDFIAGQALDEYQADGVRSVRETLRLFLKICHAVHAAHLRGVIHRDLKPSNIRVDPAGEPHVLDFGLAKLMPGSLEEPGAAAVTVTGQFVGSLPWASPEQAEGVQEQVDLRTDVYSLGVNLYRMLTGQFPYGVTGRMRDVLDNILHAEPAKPRRLHPAIDDEVETIVLKCLHKDRERRYQTAGELARDIERYLAGELIEAKRDSGWYLLRKTLRRYRWPATIVAGFLIVVTGAALALSVMYTRQTRLLAAEEAARRNGQRLQAALENMLVAVSQVGKGTDLALRRGLLDEAAQAVERELGAEPEARAWAHDMIGRTYRNLGLYDEAEQHLRAALAERQALLGREHPQVATSLNNLGELLTDRNQFAEAEGLFREALTIRQKLFGGEHPDVAQSLNNLGLVMQYRHDYDAAEKLHRAALEMCRRLRGDAHPDVVNCLLQLGNALSNKEEYAAAEPVYRQALALVRGLYGDEHRDTAAGKISLAKLLYVRGDYAASEPLFREALATYRRLLGDEHDNVAWGLHRLGVLLHARGDYAGAEQALRESLAIYRKCFGDSDFYVTLVLDSLGTLLLDEGDYAAAQPLFEEALSIWRGRLDEFDPFVLWKGNRLGEMWQLRGDYATAEPLLRAALAHRGERRGVEYPYLARTLNSLAALLLERGDCAEAEALYREALELRRDVLGPEHPDVAQSLVNLGRVLCVQADYEVAEPLLREGLARQRRLLGDDHPQVVRSVSELAALAGTNPQAGALLRDILAPRALQAEEP
jgi:tetratricopeptide (TPR) repeat protein